MANLKLDLSNLSIVSGKFIVLDSTKTNLKYAGNRVLEVTDTKITFNDGSTLELVGSTLKFTALSGSGTFAAESYVSDISGAVNTIIGSINTAGKTNGAVKSEIAELLESAKDNTLEKVVLTAASTAMATTNDDDDYTNGLSSVSSSVTADPVTLDTIDFSAAGSLIVDTNVTAGFLKDVTTIIGSESADKITAGASVTSVETGDGNDFVELAGVATVGSNFALGDGNDTLKISALATVKADVTLGDGADVVDIAVAGASVSVSDYNFYDGDVVKLTYTNAKLDDVALDNTSQLSFGTGNKVSVAATSIDNVAAAYVATGKDALTLYTATADAEVEIDASSAGKVNVDTTKTTSNAANITLGSGEANVTLNSGTAKKDVINVNSAKKVTVTNFKDKDELDISGATFKDLSISIADVDGDSTKDDAVLTYGSTTVNLIDGKALKTIALNDKTMAVDLGSTGEAMSDVTADMYYGNADKKSTVHTVGSVHLADTDKYKNIYNVSVNVAATADEDDKLNLSGFTTTGTTGISIDASSAAVGVNVWAYNKNTKATDTINLGSGNAYQDTVSFASNDGKDSVTGFTFGNAENSDILYLRDTKELQKLAVKQGTVKIGSSQLSLGHATGTTDVLQVKLADGTSSLIAGNFSTVPGDINKVNVSLTSTDAIDFYALSGTKNELTLVKNGDEAVSFRYSNLDANHTAGTSVKSVSVGAGFEEDDEITIGAVANVTTGAGNNHVWVYGVADSAKIQLGSSEGKDQVDFASGIDKKVTVTNYDVNEDTIYLRGTGDEDLKAITANYKFAAKNNGIQITGVENASSVLVLDNVGELKIKTLNGSELTAIVNENDANTPVAFSKDVSIYAGMKKIEADMSVDGEIAVRVGTKGEIGIDSSDTYYISDSVTEFDASSSDAVFRLAGSSTAGTTLKGGNTENSFYGGGSFSDTMVGNSSAVDTFYFGKGDGKDTILEADGKDTVVLLNVELDDVTVDTAKNALVINSADTLTFGENASEAFIGGELTIKIAGSEYVCQEGKLVAKNA